MDDSNPANVMVKDLGPVPEDWDRKKVNSEFVKAYKEWLPPEDLEAALGPQLAGRPQDHHLLQLCMRAAGLQRTVHGRLLC